MKVSDLNWEHGRVGTFRIMDPLPASVRKSSRTFLLTSSRRSEVFLAFDQNQKLLLRAEPADQTSRLLANETYDGEKITIAWVSEVHAPLLILSSHLFWRKITFPDEGPLCLMVTEQIANDLRNSVSGDICAFLSNQFLIDDLAFAQTGGRNEANAFRLIGAKYTLDIAVGRLGLQTKSLQLRRKRPSSDRITLFQGAIKFQDATLAGTQAEEISTLLRKALQSHGAYLKTWEIYNELEAVLLDQKMKEVGTLKYENYTLRQDGAETFAVFQLSKRAPVLFRQGEVPIEVLTGSDESGKEHSMPIGATVPTVSDKELRVRVFDQLWDMPPHSGELRISQRGDKVRIKRRRDALEVISQGRSPLRTLGLLLETGIARYDQTRHHKPLSERVKRLFKNSPTPAQLEALDVALNTPDIALIQGPPGTGKTSVIRALVARIAELEARFERQTVGFGETATVLVTSHQHDAVENAVDGFDVAGLPAHRYSKRRGENEEAKDSAAQKWAWERSEACRRHLNSFGAIPARQLARDVDRLISQWRRTEQKVTKLEIAQEIVERCRIYLEPVLVRSALDVISRMERPRPPVQPPSEIEERLKKRLEMLIAEQRITREMFRADGERQAGRLLRFIEDNSALIDVVVPEELRLAVKSDIEAPNFFERYQQALSSLILNKPAPAAEEQDDNADSLEMLWGQISAALHARAATGKDAIAEALQAFMDELADPEAVRAMVKNYAQVVAATCQQSVSKSYAEGRAQFEVVVVDEAARAHPLDLLIPLSRGKRIILVGDHNQLPQMLEPEVIEEYKAINPGTDTSLLEKSVFEKLFEQFEEVEKRGGAKRVVTLTDDFRMHPSISKLVSEIFYGRKVKARCAEVEREHGLPLYDGKALGWLDFPRSRGPEKGRQSKSRRVEIEAVFSELQKILSQRNDRSVGVITFYERQAEMLEVERTKLPFEHRSRVRVGTVDAFQGREFDIILLSTVRSNNERRDLKNRVGFLASRNRLCVAFSRARMLLVVIGDADTIAGSEGDPAVAEFLTLLKACREGDGYYERR